MNRFKTILFLGTILALGTFALAAEAWQTKPYTEWNVKDATRLLDKSPWVSVFSWGDTTAMRNIANEADDMSMGSEREWVILITSRLFTARPVRQAYVVLRAKGDKAALEKYKDFATADINEEIIVSWTYDSKPKGVSALRDLDALVRSVSVADLKPSTFIVTDAGKRVYIQDYRPPTKDGTGAKFSFPRTLEDGTPLIDENTKTLRFQTGYFRLKDQVISVDATFKLKEMAFEGKAEY